jgi:hypothetical protein
VRAEQILAELGANDLAGDSKVLNSGLDARIAALAETIGPLLPEPRPVELEAIEETLDRLREHRRSSDRGGEVAAAMAAARLARWLAGPEQLPATVADGAAGQLRSWGWVDRAAAEVFNADTSRVPRAQAVYAALFKEVRVRRARLDRAFAERLKGWSAVAGPTGDLLLAENLLERIARPVAERGAPLIIVLDGMSVAASCSLAEDIAATRLWTETGRNDDGREAAVATIPSATAFSRTTLFCGELRTGGQAEERAGFAAFWRGRRTALFHKAGIRAGAGALLSDELQAAIQDPGTAVGVVLNTIDDALRDDFRVTAPTWRLDQIDYLRPLLTAAATVGRPVILTSDHGHVLEYGSDLHPAKGDAARFRTGAPSDGELSLKGLRVLTTGNSVTVPWDERIRYVPRKAGYHGGVALAEMIIPVLVFVPAGVPAPQGWATYENASLHEPPWWNSVPPDSPEVAKPKKATSKPTVQDDMLFSLAGAAAEAAVVAREGLGARIIESQQFATQQAFVRKAPDQATIAALIDGMVAAGGKVPMSMAAELTGQPPFRMAGFLAVLGRLLNVDGYQVIVESDGGRTLELDIKLLRLQFLGER